MMMGKRNNRVERVITGLEIDESIDLHIKAWKIQPLAWWTIALFVLAGVAGCFGTGPISKVRYTKGSIEINYQRFHRHGLLMPLRIRTTGENNLSVALPHPFLESCRVESIFPEPHSFTNALNEVTYRFSGPSCTFFFLPESSGREKVEAIINGQQVDFSLFIFP